MSWSSFELARLIGKTSVLIINAAEDRISPVERQKGVYLKALQREGGKGGAREILVVDEGRGHLVAKV